MSMMRDANDFVCNPGDRYRPVRTSVVLDDGTIDVVVTGKEDLQAYINSFEQSCNINVIMERYTGDPSVLQRGNPTYGDFTKAPKTLADVLQRVIDSQAVFAQLKPEVRAKFDNDYNKFLVASFQDNFLDVLGVAPAAGADPAAGTDPAADTKQ